ncbi:MAG: imidazole glycerol phosphate synthase subunit HisH [Phycisphaerae bacterium]|nr:imidazole glycerol phosphate synthase subunit HisH [Phycisphaerae bacterium]
MIVVIDYNVGNVKSVRNALDFIGLEDKLSADPADIEKADGIILPGVAAFGYAVKALGKTAEVVKEVVRAGKPILGICVGFQLLFDHSCEMGDHKGLGLIAGDVKAIPPGRTIPHMGWNAVKIADGMDLFAGLNAEEHFYFAHSYHAAVTDADARIAYTDYGLDMAASVQKGNIFGVQFHPEKSSKVGLRVLQNFDAICRNGGRSC